jgi:hypothetical protein
MSIMNEKKFGRILETGMGFIMSWVLNTSAMYLLGAPMTPATVFPAWVGAFAIAVAINYFAPVMDWVASWTKRIKNKTLEYEILFNSVWCMYNSGNIVYWPAKFPILLAVGTIAIFISLPIMVRVATACAKK